MSSIRRQYPFHLIEPKWQAAWDRQQTYRAWNPHEHIPPEHPFARRHPGKTATDLPKYYLLDMFPYPSGAGLHVGHPEGYTATDILARYRRALGYHVLHPMGWDAFGLPAEQHAVRTGQHPRHTAEQSIANFKRQIQSLGFSYDWTREVNTTDPAYFRWTQWIFLQLYHAWFNPASHKAEPITTLVYPPEVTTESDRRDYRDARRLAYVTEAPVWWCEQLGTVLANEEVVDGRSEVGGFPVIRRPMRQWMLRITAYAERLVQDLNLLDWTESLKEMQRNWIGRSEGAEVRFSVADGGASTSGCPDVITVFTTRPDTLFGATYLVLAPEHPLVNTLTPATHRPAVDAYRAGAAAKSDLERTDLAKEKAGIFTGAWAINPVNQEPIPIWIADYVLASYGTGAIMAVPAHDTRDLEFARRFDLPVRVVVQAPEGLESVGYVEDGVSINSDLLNGLPTPEAKQCINDWLEARGVGQRRIQHRLRDWLFSRQRYWGEPFPIVWRLDPQGIPYHEALPESALPIEPPHLTDFKPTASGQPPLARAQDWVRLPDGATRETNTMPQWAGSCWYYLRYLDPQNTQRFCSPEAERYWMGTPASPLPSSIPNPQLLIPDPQPPANRPGVDLYVGGTEHAVLHLLYARFWHKVLFDLGHVSTSEPFARLVNQGLILGEDGQKMSKSCGNVINPDVILAEYGADAFRLYEMFMGPIEMVKPWNTRGVEGVYRFLGRVWRLLIDDRSETEFEQACTAQPDHASQHLILLRLQPAIRVSTPDRDQLRTLHACIKKVTDDLDHLRFNTAISALMVFVNEAMTWPIKPASVLAEFLVLLQPFAPHLAEELWSKLIHHVGDTEAPPILGLRNSEIPIAYQPWPKLDLAFLAEDTLELPVQVNGKLRDRIVVPAGTAHPEIEQAALASPKVRAFIDGKTVRKIILVPDKLVNIVVG